MEAIFLGLHSEYIVRLAGDRLNSQEKKEENAELLQAIKKMKAVLKKIPDEEIVRAIRESRDQR